jgi:hypothetical protein
MIYRAFFDRNEETTNGFFTLQDEKGKKLFERLPARSGQTGYTKTDWIRSRSPIPYSKWIIKPYRLWLASVNVGMTSKANGIGEFFPISNTEGSREIQGPYHGQERMDIGLHWENDKPGSAGCIVLLNDTPERRDQVKKLFARLHTIKQPYIELIVL